jgi:hypothetical protein
MGEIRLQLERRSTCECLGGELGEWHRVREEVKAFPFRGTSQVVKHQGQKPLEPVDGIELSDEPIDRRSIALLQDIREEFV